MPEYRKMKTSDTWHWVRNCSKWPTYDYEVARTEPKYDKFCEECKQKQNPEDLE